MDEVLLELLGKTLDVVLKSQYTWMQSWNYWNIGWGRLKKSHIQVFQVVAVLIRYCDWYYNVDRVCKVEQQPLLLAMFFVGYANVFCSMGCVSMIFSAVI